MLALFLFCLYYIFIWVIIYPHVNGILLRTQRISTCRPRAWKIRFWLDFPWPITCQHSRPCPCPSNSLHYIPQASKPSKFDQNTDLDYAKGKSLLFFRWFALSWRDKLKQNPSANSFEIWNWLVWKKISPRLLSFSS